jgi:hypothetical protein
MVSPPPPFGSAFFRRWPVAPVVDRQQVPSLRFRRPVLARGGVIDLRSEAEFAGALRTDTPK